MNFFKNIFLITIFTISLFAASMLLEQVLQMYKNNTLKDNPQALKALIKSAKDNADISFLLATSYKDGKAGIINYSEAAKWYLNAAKLGDSDAMLMLGWIYYEGRLSKGIDIKKAKYWFLKAADMGVDEAIEMLYLLNS